MKINTVSALLLVTNLMINISVAILDPFFPPLAIDKGVNIDVVGYVFSIYPLTFVIVSLLMPKVLLHINKRIVFVLGSLIYALSIMGFGLIIFSWSTTLLYYGISIQKSSRRI